MDTSKDTKYISPNIVVDEIGAMNVLCQSGVTVEYNDGGDSSDWF